MGARLYETQPVFRAALDALRRRCSTRMLERPLLRGPVAGAGRRRALLDQTAYTQPALFALEYALAALWRAWGVEPDGRDRPQRRRVRRRPASPACFASRTRCAWSPRAAG